MTKTKSTLVYTHFSHFSQCFIHIFELSFNERISKELLNEWANQCKLGELKSQQEFSRKEEWFTKNWMTEKPVNQHNSEKDANNKERFKRSTHYKTFN